MVIDRWVTLEGKSLDTSKIPSEERALIKEAVDIYWATVCPGIKALATVPPMDWTPFAAWWFEETRKRGFQHRIGHPDGRNPTFQVLQDLEGRIGVHQGKCAQPKEFCSSYWPFWA